MKFDILNVKGDKVGDATADKDIFGVTPNQNAVRQAVLSELNNMRQGTHSSKNRALVNGGGKKPFKQKGRGGARAGTIRSPLWKGGGTVFGPEPHSYNHKLPKKLSKLARRSVLSSKAAEGNLIVIDEFSMESHKTSEFVSILKKLKLQDKKLTLLTSEKGNGNLDMSVRNLYNVSLVDYRKASTYDMIDCDLLIIDNNSMKMLAEMLKD
tara:strand:- start:4177 stop:4806 length:630 start_codon:yes stop_codon:yes gene_type:complete